VVIALLVDVAFFLPPSEKTKIEGSGELLWLFLTLAEHHGSQKLPDVHLQLKYWHAEWALRDCGKGLSNLKSWPCCLRHGGRGRWNEDHGILKLS
jgi:hypothetical protein